MAEDQPVRIRIWSLRQARETVDLQVTLFPELQAELIRLSRGKIGLFNPILDLVADGVSFDPEAAVTPEVFRRYSGAPEDPSQLEAWRKTTYDKYQLEHRPPRTSRP